MTEAKLFALVGAGGALGAMARFAVGRLGVALWGAGFPWGTLLVNIVGSFLMGLFVHWAALRPETAAASSSARLFFAVGLLGAFTTFSTFSLDVVTLFRDRHIGLGAGYIGASVLLSIGALIAGLEAARRFL